MARSVYPASEVAHVWASQSVTEARARETDGGAWQGCQGARCPNGSAYFEGRALYSYGRHYMTGFILKPHGGGEQGVVLLNSSKNSVTTNRRRWDAERATSHYLQLSAPDIEDISDILAGGAATSKARSRAGEYESAAERMAGYLAKHAESVTDETAAYLLKYAGGRVASWPKIKREAEKAKAKEAARDAKREADSRLTYGQRFADLPEDEFRALWPEDAPEQFNSYQRGKTYGRKAAEEFGRNLSRYLTAARAAKMGKRRLDILASRVKAYREHLRGMQPRWEAVQRAEFVAAFEAFKAGADLSKPVWQFNSWAPELVPEIELIKREREAAANAAAFAAWRQGDGARPALSCYNVATPEYGAIQESEREERARHSSAYVAWVQDPVTADRPAAEHFLSGPLKVSHPEAWQVLRQAAQYAEQAERRERERATFESWLRGAAGVVPREFHSDEGGGAYIRRSPDGENLETSQGARVPWEHAVKAFRFIKRCRERGEGWNRNGRTVRVGHYQIDSITAAGDFRAGCHFFRWPEIERLAREHGVFDLAPDDSAVESNSAHAHG